MRPPAASNALVGEASLADNNGDDANKETIDLKMSPMEQARTIGEPNGGFQPKVDASETNASKPGQLPSSLVLFQQYDPTAAQIVEVASGAETEERSDKDPSVTKPDNDE